MYLTTMVRVQLTKAQIIAMIWNGQKTGEIIKTESVCVVCAPNTIYWHFVETFLIRISFVQCLLTPPPLPSPH